MKMRIQENRLKKTLFNEIPCGGVFKYGDYFFVRILTLYDSDGDAWNAISLIDGEYDYIEDSAGVEGYPNAYLVIE